MRTRYTFVFTAVALFVCAAASAQNLDPTVEVSRAYEGKLVEVSKPVREMTVPDSVSTFRLDFDYSVFEKPYKGAYDFTPYMMAMRPETVLRDRRTFYLKAGAGYRLNPVLDLFWTPSLGKGLSLDVYAMHGSYVGDYREISQNELVPGRYALSMKDNARWKNGYDLKSQAGADLRYEWGRGIFAFNAGYYGLAGKNPLRTRCYDALDVNAIVASNKNEETNFIYRVAADYRFAEDKLMQGGAACIVEHLASADISLGPVFKHGHNVRFDFGADAAVYKAALNGAGGRFHFTPRYILKKGRLSLDAGVRLDLLFGSSDQTAMFHTGSQQYVYPDVKVDFAIIKKALDIYAKVGGGTRMNTYASIVDRNHYADAFTVLARPSVLDNDVERVNASVGLRGSISTRFSYDLRGGYANIANGLLDAFAMSFFPYVAQLGYASYQKAFAAFDWRWDSEDFKFDGTVEYVHAWDFDSSSCVFAPAFLTADAAFEYNWRRRIFVGVDCEFSTGRKLKGQTGGLDIVLPWYADLGVSAEYAFNRKLSFWLRGGNLCCMTIQRTPLYAEGGINFTAGICLNL